MFLRRRSDTRTSPGQALVEFALVLPILALLTVIAVDFGRVFFSYIQITNAAREAAAFGAVTPALTTEIENAALREANVQGQGGESPIQVSTECRNTSGIIIACAAAPGGAGPGNTLTVKVAEEFSFITPLVNDILNNNFVMRVSATSTVLGYAGSGSSGPPPGTCSAPIASFTVIITSGTSIQVDPAGSSPNAPGNPCNISGYNWEWGNGEDAVGAASAADYTYPAPGTYTITLEVTNQGGASTATELVTVPAGSAPVCEAPDASYTYTSSGSGGKTHTYIDTSTVADAVNCPIVAWLWTFPDGSVSNAPAPAPQVYGTSNKHTTKLDVTNAGGTDTFSWNH